MEQDNLLQIITMSISGMYIIINTIYNQVNKK